MNWKEVEGNWTELKGKAKQRWARLTDDDLLFIAGQREKLRGRLQQTYGTQKEEVEKDIDAFIDELTSSKNQS